jgi:hypothetical protein
LFNPEGGVQRRAAEEVDYRSLMLEAQQLEKSGKTAEAAKAYIRVMNSIHDQSDERYKEAKKAFDALREKR